MKITQFEIENVKKIKAVNFEPENGLNVIGGKNTAGKTSILDAICFALGGAKYKPSEIQREGSVKEPYIKITLDNGFIVERKGKNSSLSVTDPSGQKVGQKILSGLISELALNLPKFLESTSAEKAKTLLKIIGVEEELYNLEQREKSTYDTRYDVGRDADRKMKYYQEMEHFPDAPEELQNISELSSQLQKVLIENSEKQKLQNHLNVCYKKKNEIKNEIAKLNNELGELQAFILQTEKKDLSAESTNELQEKIDNIENINSKVRANQAAEKAKIEADEAKSDYDDLTKKLEQIRKEKLDLLYSADFPLEGLTVKDDELVYNGKKWDCMSAAEQLFVSTAIIQKIKPDCKFILLDKLEQFDLDTLQEFADWAEKQDLQIIGTRVSTGDECSIVIEDGGIIKQLTNKQKEEGNIF